MAQIRDIKRRITSVKNTQQITRAMKMVAAAKLRRAQNAMLAMRPYADHLTGILERVEYDLFGDEHPLFMPREEKAAASIVIAGDKGLCGAFNTNIIRRARQHFAEMPGVDHRVYSIGRRATAALRKRGHTIVHDYQEVFDNLSYLLANSICEELVRDFMAGTIDSAYVVYNEFVTVMSQKPQVRKILPIDFPAMAEARRTRERAAHEGTLAEMEAEVEKPAEREVFDFDPDPHTVLERLISHLIATEVHRATLESYAAELGARMTAMDSATNNAGEMIDRLTMEYNRARQSNITGELLDIVGGAEGLKG
jgi:F-type H+-transporting ATPase subunit gamma